MTHLLNRLLGEKVRLSVDCANPLFPVRADERQIEQVIMNLVVNARDAMPDGGEVYLAARNEELDRALHRGRARIEKGKYVLVTVRDTGSGIPALIIDNIFEPFFTTKRQGEGTGLGLSTAYGIVKQTEGFIFAENAQGGGAEFEIFIPAAGSAEVTPPKKREPAETQNRPRRGNVRVLLVEDEAPVRSFVSRALAHRGFDVTEAATGEEALKICEGAETSFDLVITDVIMPGLDGPGWAKQAGFSTSEAPIIFMSGYAEDDSEAALAEFANRYFLTKPFSLKELTELSEIALQECSSPLKASS